MDLEYENHFYDSTCLVRQSPLQVLLAFISGMNTIVISDNYYHNFRLCVTIILSNSSPVQLNPRLTEPHATKPSCKSTVFN